MNKIIESIRDLKRPELGYNIFEKDNVLWGIGSKGEIVFGIDSSKTNFSCIVQSTKYIKLFICYDFICRVNGVDSTKKVSLYVLNSNEEKLRELFIRICWSMKDKIDEEIMLKNFFDLRTLFTNKKKPSSIELQGMYGELFTMYYLKTNYDVDISIYYQKEEKRKFDFSINDYKKIEVKTTQKPERVHHFLHQQLDTDKFDIKIVSLLLQKDDFGMSLLELINKCKELFANYLIIILHIEMMVKNIDEEDLDEIKYNAEYAKKNLKIFNVTDIPKLKEKNSDGVFNIEYDVDLENVTGILPNDLIEWIKNSDIKVNY